MRRNEARNLIPEDQTDENAMEQKASRTEADIAKIELGMSEFRGDMKAANEAIVDVKIAVGAIDGKISALNTKIDAQAEVVDARFKAVDFRFDATDAKIDALAGNVDARFDAMDKRVGSLESKFDKMSEDIHSLKGMNKAVIWLLTAGFGGLIAFATLAKMLHWI